MVAIAKLLRRKSEFSMLGNITGIIIPLKVPPPGHTLRFSIFLLWLLYSPFLLGQGLVSGFVKGTKGEPVVGATISIKGTNLATSSQDDGSFTIKASPGNILLVSFTGYQSSEIKLGSQSSVSIVLVESSSTLEEILVTGYSTQRAKEITGSVAVVKPKDLAAVPAGQVEQMLQGQVAGLTVITSGMPGGASNVRLHGIGNFGDVTPLYIIDGVQGNINNLNPNDIESIQVLKDAGAYSIYGVRGANGVIVITTRSGKRGKTKVSYDFSVGTTRPLKGLDVLSPQEVADLRWTALKNSGRVDANGNPADLFYGNLVSPVLPDYYVPQSGIGIPAGDPSADPALYNIDYNLGGIYQIVQSNKSGTNWFHTLFRPAVSQNHTIAVAGGNEKNKYHFSLGYLDQQGTFLHTYLKRYTARINTEFSINEKVRIGENLQLTYKDNPQVATQNSNNEIFQSIVTQPIMPVYDINGGWAHLQRDNFLDNPVALREVAQDNKSHFWEVFGNAYAEADFLNIFTLRSSFGGNLINYYSHSFSFYSYEPSLTGLADNSFMESSGYRRSWTWTNTLKLKQTINTFHTVAGLIGTESISNYNREVGGKKNGFFTSDPNYRFLSNGSQYGQSNYSFAGASTLSSVIGRIDYNYYSKYFVTATVRRDGSSVFAPQNRHGWFPSLSAAWRMTEESWMKQLNWIHNLKLRGSWGKTGFHGNTDPFNQFTLYGGTIGDAYYDIGANGRPSQGFRLLRIGDSTTTWQEDVVTNVGLDLSLFKGAITISLDWYKKKTKGLLFPVSLPDILGGAISPATNVGMIQNKGLDILITTKQNLWSDVNLDATLTFSTYRNKILKLSGLEYFIPPLAPAGSLIRNQVGHPMSMFYGYQIIALFQDEADVLKSPIQDAAAPGRFKYRDANNDGRITEEDRIFIGNPNPDFTCGFNFTISYRNFDFSTFLYCSFGNDVNNGVRFVSDFFPATSKAALYDSWTPERKNAIVPKPEVDFNFSTKNPPTSFAIENGAYLRNKSLIIGYTIPPGQIGHFNIDRVRIYLQAGNLFTITKYSGLDPELPGQSAAFGEDFGNYPNNQKQYLIGLNINF